MAKSVRFNQELEFLLEEAAQALGVSQSTLIPDLTNSPGRDLAYDRGPCRVVQAADRQRIGPGQNCLLTPVEA
jgi:hypothetical protein